MLLNHNLYTYCFNNPVSWDDPSGRGVLDDYQYQVDMKKRDILEDLITQAPNEEYKKIYEEMYRNIKNVNINGDIVSYYLKEIDALHLSEMYSESSAATAGLILYLFGFIEGAPVYVIAGIFGGAFVVSDFVDSIIPDDYPTEGIYYDYSFTYENEYHVYLVHGTIGPISSERPRNPLSLGWIEGV